MAEPKKKTSKANTRSRRHQIKMNNPAMVYCEKCHQPKLRHHVCIACGSYKNKVVLATQEASEEK
jgi:large subunit ribosomal protein L32